MLSFCLCWLAADGNMVLDQWFSDLRVLELPRRLVKIQIAYPTPIFSDPVGPERTLSRGISNKFPSEMLMMLVWGPHFEKYWLRRQHATGKELGYIVSLEVNKAALSIRDTHL